MQWFRFYSEALDDPKIQTLPAEVFKVWINVLCLAAKQKNSDGEIGTLHDVSFALRETKDSVSSAFHTLTTLGLIVTVNETFHVSNWKKRQFKSDSSTNRVKQYRKRFRNVTVTPPDTDTDTDKEKTTKKKISLQELSVTHISDWLAEKRRKGKYLAIDESSALEYFKNYCASRKKTYSDYAAAFRNSFEWEVHQKPIHAKPKLSNVVTL